MCNLYLHIWAFGERLHGEEIDTPLMHTLALRNWILYIACITMVKMWQ